MWHVGVGGAGKELQPDTRSSRSEQQEGQPCEAKQKAGRKEAGAWEAREEGMEKSGGGRQNKPIYFQTTQE